MELGIHQGFCCQEREQIAQQWLTMASEEDRTNPMTWERVELCVFLIENWIVVVVVVVVVVLCCSLLFFVVALVIAFKWGEV